MRHLEMSLVAVCVLACVAGAFQPLSAASPIAHYPLQSDANDALGSNGPMTVVDAPFQDGGVYCNGIYPSTPGGSQVWTPPIVALNYESFSVAADFLISEHPAPGSFPWPILIGGLSWRFLGAEVYPDGTIGMLYNNSNRVTSAQTVTLGAWHRLLLTYDSASGAGMLYLDSALATSAVFALEHGDEEHQNDDRNFGPLNPSNATAFLGLFRNLVVYDATFDPTLVESITWGRLKRLMR